MGERELRPQRAEGREEGGRQARAGHCSHVDDVLDVEVLQGGQVRVHAPLVLEDDLLEDAVQELPLLQVAAVPLVWGHRQQSALSPGPLTLASRLVRAPVPSPGTPQPDGGRMRLPRMENLKPSHFPMICD